MSSGIAIKDLSGETFNKLKVLKKSDKKDSQGNYYWDCKCECGNNKIVQTSYLTKNIIRSCGCLKYDLGIKCISCGNTILYRNSISGLKNKNNKRCKSCRMKAVAIVKNSGNSLINLNRLFKVYKRNAIDKNLFFELDKDFFHKITSKNCHYCGIEPKQIMFRKGTKEPYLYNGIDRVNSSKGYILNNVVPCCRICNCAKMELNVSEFVKSTKRRYKFFCENYKE